MLRLCYDLGVEDVARLSGGEVNGRYSSLVFLNGSIVGATGCVVAGVRRSSLLPSIVHWLFSSARV